MNTRASHLFLAVALSAIVYAQPYQMTVTTNAPLPPPNTYAEMLDAAAGIFVNVTNSGADTDVRVQMTMSHESGKVIRTNETAAIELCTTIPSGFSTYTVQELGDAFFTGGFNSAYFDFEGISPAQIRDDQMLPGPAWTICIQLFECNGMAPLSSPQPGGCVTFPVMELPPPMLAEICNATYTQPDGMLMISWLYSPPPGYMNEVDYNLRIVKIEPTDGREGDANDAMLSATEPYEYNGVIDESPALIEIPEGLVLEAGYRYAVQVQAIGVESFLPVQNQGLSEVCSFLYAPESTGGTGLLRPIWPVNDNWYPFDYVNVITKFEPFRNYTRFHYTTTLRELGGSNRPDHERTLTWRDGPPQSQSDVTFAMDEFHSQHLSVYVPDVGAGGGFLTRGKRYQWRTVGDFTLGSSTYHGDTGEELFGCGMGPSQPLSPVDGIIVDAGVVPLQWNTAAVPSPLVPPYTVVQATGSDGTTFINGWTSERWKLEVSKQEDFSTIFYETTGMIGGIDFDLMEATDDPASFQNEMYKNLNAEVTATENGTYYWRLHWKVDPADINSANYNTSPVFRFTIGPPGTTPGTEEEEEEEEVERPCVSDCLHPAPTNNTTISSITTGMSVKVGKFVMEIENATGSGTFSGQGKVPVEFLNDAKIKVEFTGLRVNTDNEMIAGTVTARKDWNPASLAMVSSGARMIPSIDSSDAVLMNGFIEDGARLVSLLTSGSEMGLPIGMDREIDGRQVILGIVNMVFTPTRAHLDMVAGIEIVEVPTMLSFGIGDMCMSPGGLGDQGRAYLAADIDIPDGDFTFKFKGGASTDTTNITYIDWDCNGFKCMQLAAGMEFSRDNIIPPGDTASTSTNKVEAHFKVQMCTEWNFLAQFTMDPFEARGAPGWVFNIEEAWVDLSSRNNPPTILFPQGYDHPHIIGGAATANLWTGFFLKRLSMHAPEVLLTDGTASGAGTGISVNNFIIDDLGLSFNFALTNLISINEGKLDSWAFSLDSIYMDVMKSRFRRAGLKGMIGMPINGEHDYLKYQAVLGVDDTDTWALNLQVDLEDTLTVPMWIAEMELRPNSFVRATISSESRVHAELHGKIGISTDAGSSMGIDLGSTPSISMPGMDFEDLVLDSRDGISCTTCAFSYASPDKDMGGFPLSIRDLSLELSDPTHPALYVEPMLSLSGDNAALGASVGIRFITQLDIGTGGVQHFGFDRVEIGRIGLDVTMNGVVLRGSIEMTHTETKDEFRGDIYVGLPMGIAGNIQAIFGTVKNDPTAAYNTAGYYSYWMVDGMIYFSSGLPIFSGVGIYGFGGGLYHHMQMQDGSLPTNDQLASGPIGNTNTEDSTATNATRPSGARYVEHYPTLLGLRLGLVFGNYPGPPETYNMDVNLRTEFSESGGLVFIALSGDLYGLVGLTNRDEAKITAGFDIRYDKRGGVGMVDGTFNVMLDFGIIHGAGENNRMVDAHFHTEPGKWFFKMGTPTNRGGIVIDFPILNARIENYIMAGNYDIPSELPPPPPEIMTLLGLGGEGKLGTEAETAAAINDGRTDETMTSMATGAGFAFGAFFSLETDISLAILYAKFGIMLGFDINLTQIPEDYVCANLEPPIRPGEDGWFAQGQLYAGLWGELGVQLDLLFVRFRAPILNLSAAMLLQGNMPNPFGFRGYAAVHYSVLGGRISGTARFKAEAGEPCYLSNAGDPLKSIRFIKDVAPRGNDVDVFDYPTASFEMGMNQLLEIPRYMDPETGAVEMYRFYPYVAEFKLKNTVNGQWVPGSTKFTGSEGKAVYLERDNVLEDLTTYQATVVVKVMEETAPGVRVQYKHHETQQIWAEDSVVNFTTGIAPDHIRDQDVDYTYPVDRQRFFMQNESNNKGKVQLVLGRPQLFAETIDAKRYTYVARWIPTHGGDALETPITYSGGKVLPLTVPVLDIERVYQCQLLRRRVNTTATGIGLPNAINPGSNAIAGNFQNTLAQTFTNNLTNESVTYALQGARITSAVSMASGDKLLYKFNFRTSKYNTLQEKMASTELSGVTPVSYGMAGWASVRGNNDEGFDEVDMDGVWKSGQRKLDPLVNFYADYSDDYFKYINARMYSKYYGYCAKRYYAFDTQVSISMMSVPGKALVDLASWPVPSYLLWKTQQPNSPIFDLYSYPKWLLSDSELGLATQTTQPAATGGPGTTIGGMPSIAGGLTGNINLGGSGFSVGNTVALLGGSGILANAAPSYNLNLTFRAGAMAFNDYMVVRNKSVIALNTPSRGLVLSNGIYYPVSGNYGTLRSLLQLHGPSVTLQNMRFLGQTATTGLVDLLHEGNMPAPDEFNTTYTNRYHVTFKYRAPITLSQNTFSKKQFFITHETPDYSGTVLH